jgi:peptidoglycan/LPS O-acetylase OafA/YrhL
VPAKPTEKVKVFFPNLDGLRFVAFLFVFLQHSFATALNKVDFYKSFLLRVIQLIFNSGETGVSVFFVLSGFLITYLLLDENDVKGKINVLYFYLRRILRIWPLYYALLLLSFVIWPYIRSLNGLPPLLSNPIYYFTFLSNFDVIRISSLAANLHYIMQTITWSVSVEEQFYLVWPLLFFILPKKSYKYIFVVVIILGYIFRFINRNNDAILYHHSLSVCPDLAIGGLSAYLSYNFNSFRNMLYNLNKWVIILTYVLLFFWIFYTKETKHTHAEISVFFRLITSTFFAFIILEQNYCKNSFYKFSNFKFFSNWGKYTYGLYLLHPAVLLVIYYLFEIFFSNFDLHLPQFAIFYSFFSLLGVMIVSYFSFNYLEKPFLKLKDKFSLIITKH